MDLLIVDYDCKLLIENNGMEFRSQAIKVIYLDSELLSEDLTINNSIMREVTRCVILTRFSGGVKKYHWDIISKNSMVKHWIISIIDLDQDIYKEQFLKQVDTLLFGPVVFYEVIFDTAKNFMQTKRVLDKPMKMKKKCMVISKNVQLAKNAADIFKRYLKEWEIEIPQIKSSDDYQYADAVLIVGEKGSECAVIAPKVGVRKRKIWINRRFLNKDEKEEMFEQLEQHMNANGWNIADYSDKTYFSDLLYEDFREKLYRNEISYLSLCEQEDFVVWDKYGLPLIREGYTEETVTDFLEKQTCFSKIANDFQYKS